MLLFIGSWEHPYLHGADTIRRRLPKIDRIRISGINMVTNNHFWHAQAVDSSSSLSSLRFSERLLSEGKKNIKLVHCQMSPLMIIFRPKCPKSLLSLNTLRRYQNHFFLTLKCSTSTLSYINGSGHSESLQLCHHCHVTRGEATSRGDWYEDVTKFLIRSCQFRLR